jgi:hypothetical protein
MVDFFKFVNFHYQLLKKMQGAYMFRLVAFIMAAAIVAGAATFFLALTPEVEASAPKAAVKGDRLDIRPVQGVRGACMQRGWPVYETECRRNHIVGLPRGLGTSA